MCLPHAARQGAGDRDASLGGRTGLLPIELGEELWEFSALGGISCRGYLPHRNA